MTCWSSLVLFEWLIPAIDNDSTCNKMIWEVMRNDDHGEQLFQLYERMKVGCTGKEEREDGKKKK